MKIKEINKVYRSQTGYIKWAEVSYWDHEKFIFVTKDSGSIEYISKNYGNCNIKELYICTDAYRIGFVVNEEELQ